MSKSFLIPESKQLEALASGLRDVYRLLAEYLGDLNSVPDFKRHITVTRKQLADYLRSHPELAELHISDNRAAKFHEGPVLERVDGKYRVYESDHGRPWNTKEFNQLAEAAATYLMWGW